MPNTKRKPVTRKKRAADEEGIGPRIIAGLKEINAAMKAGGLDEVRKRFTVYQVKRTGFDRPALAPADVAAIRATLGASQAVFAALLGVSANTVRAWEQGVNPPSGMAVRFLAEVRRDPGYWKARVEEAAGRTRATV
jgi:DNA-binding transcriptional regulator YiaG